MKEFIELRRKAREKRDLAINLVRRDYAETLARIAAVEQDLTGRDSSSHRMISACIEKVIPQDREFTTLDILASLEALDPARTWRMRSVIGHIFRLRERGLVRRLRKARLTEPAIYVRVGVDTKPRAFEGQTLAQAIRATLGDKAMTISELIVTLLEAGWDTNQGRKHFRNHVGTSLRKNGFKQVGGKWIAG